MNSQFAIVSPEYQNLFSQQAEIGRAKTKNTKYLAGTATWIRITHTHRVPVSQHFRSFISIHSAMATKYCFQPNTMSGYIGLELSNIYQKYRYLCIFLILSFDILYIFDSIPKIAHEIKSRKLLSNMQLEAYPIFFLNWKILGTPFPSVSKLKNWLAKCSGW